MKLKTINKLFAATAAGFLFTNASIAAKAEELPQESTVVSEQNVSGKEAGESSEDDAPAPAQTETDGENAGQET
ncbi:MAG: hypothetical protein K2G19_06745, partial [Lachnospiraceae bacterium]|nr:hypothetical protein [Lachnospiraceae bacterium]